MALGWVTGGRGGERSRGSGGLVGGFLRGRRGTRDVQVCKFAILSSCHNFGAVSARIFSRVFVRVYVCVCASTLGSTLTAESFFFSAFSAALGTRLEFAAFEKQSLLRT